ncbi:MAG TPA: hypothetical protein VK012_00730, partial [Gemmatimonadales bacterium]|nr:hypothetical protein [Gemmatimonadales bacterium]
RIASVRLSVGTTLEEIDSVLAALSADPARGNGPLGRQLATLPPWPHIELQAAAFGNLVLEQDSEGDAEDAAADRKLWVELAQAAVSGEGPGDPAAESLLVSDTQKEDGEEVAYDRVVLSYLSQLAEEGSGRVGAGEGRLRERVARLLKTLDAETLKRLLEAGADHRDRKRAPLTSSQILSVDAVVEVLESAAGSPDHTISHNLLRLLHKLAHNSGQASTKPEAAAPNDHNPALRKNVARLLGNWGLENPNPGSYTAILQGMVRQAPSDRPGEALVPCEPSLILRMAMELDCIGPSVTSATDQLLDRREFETVASLLDSVPHSSAAQELWRRVATPERLRLELQAERPDRSVVTMLVGRMGDAAAEPLLEALENSANRSARAAALRLLHSMGAGVGPAAVARIADAPWYVQRNLLQLLADPAHWPPDFTPAAFTTSPDQRVRREAMKLMLQSPAHRAEAIERGLGDSDERIVTMALTSALEDCPGDAIESVARLAASELTPSKMRVLAMRVLTRTGSSEAVVCLTAVAFPARRWLPNRLAPKSPEVLAALAGLTELGTTDPRVRRLMADAARSRDPEVRAAAGEQA